MVRHRWLVWFVPCLVALTFARPVVAATLVADYALDGTHARFVGFPPDLVDIGPGTNAFAIDVVDGVSRTVLTFPMGNGLSLSPVSDLIPRDHYTIAMRFRLDVVDYNRRLIDFFDGQSDCGGYAYFGHLIVYCGAEGSGSMLAGT